MDQRRLFLFLTLCFLLMIAFGPKPKPPLPAGKDAAQQAEANAKEGTREQSDAAATRSDRSLPSGEPSPGQLDSERLDSDDAAGGAPREEAEIGLSYTTLGSVDPDSPYRLLVTFTNRGAGIRRIELSSPRFRDLHDRGGYLGHLELDETEQTGLLVQSVGPGTPAALAGVEVGDRIVSCSAEQEQTLLSAAGQLAEALRQRKPGQTLTLQVVRGDEQPVDRVVTLTRRPLEVIRPEAENVQMRAAQLPPGVNSPPSFQFTFEQLDKARIPATAQEIVGVTLRDSNWELSKRTDSSVTFRKQVPNFGLEVEKTYSLQQVPPSDQDNDNYPGYGLTLDIEIHNRSEQSMPLRYRLDGPNGLPIEGWWYANKISRTWSAGGLRDVVARYVGGDTVQFGPAAIATGDVETMQGPPLAFAGIDAQYFSAILLPIKPSLETLWIDELRCVTLSPKPKARSSEGRYVNATCRLISHEIQVAANTSLKHSYHIFSGPKRPDLLAEYHASESKQYGLSDLMYYGWFSAVSKGMLSVLHFFYGLIGNYGIAIIMLTVLVRGCMFPVSRKQAQSMAKMQELRPEMDKIKEKYKQDMQKQSQEMQELYRKHQINPMAGCLPMFIQLPIFLGLYRALMVDVELRQAPLLGDTIRWCSNLAAPDMFWNWSAYVPKFISSGEGIMGLGPYLNILPLVTIGLFILQQKMFMPEPANEQAALQQKIMKFMMLFMGILFFKVAAGLCIYFIASSLWGIAERKMLPKPPTPETLAVAGGPAPSSSTSRSFSPDKPAGKRSKKAKKRKR